MRKSLLGFLLAGAIAAAPALADPAQQFQIYSSKLTPVGDGTGGSKPLEVSGGTGGSCPAGTVGAIQSSDGAGNCVGTNITGLVLGNGASAPGATTIGAGLALNGSTLQQTYLIRAVTITTDTILASDAGKLVTYSNAAPIAVTLPAPTGSFGAGFSTTVQNKGAGSATFTPASGTINGAATLVVAQNLGCDLVPDGSNWQVASCTAVAPSGGGGGGVNPGAANGGAYYASAGSTVSDATAATVNFGGINLTAPLVWNAPSPGGTNLLEMKSGGSDRFVVNDFGGTNIGNVAGCSDILCTNGNINDAGGLRVATVGTGTGGFLCLDAGNHLVQEATTCVASDRRVKNDRGTITPALAVERILNLPDAHLYTYKAGYGPAGEHAGWFAQDMQKVRPTIVYKSGATDLTPDGELVFDKAEIGPDTTMAVKWLIQQERAQRAELVLMRWVASILAFGVGILFWRRKAA